MKFSSHVNLPPEAREELIALLNLGLATAIDLHWQVKQAHWNIRGRHFYSRHELFDELADRLRKQADSMAERAGTLGGYAEGTIRLAAKNSQLPEYDLQAVDGDAHLAVLVDRFARYAAGIRDSLQRSGDLGDPVTEDLLTGILAEVELDLWFLESHFQGEQRPAPRLRRDEPTQPTIPHA